VITLKTDIAKENYPLLYIIEGKHYFKLLKIEGEKNV